MFEHREGSGRARNKILVKSGNDRDFRVIVIDMEKRGRRKSIGRAAKRPIKLVAHNYC